MVGSLLFALNHRSREIRLGRRLQITLATGLELDPALSPDGKLVAFVTGPLARTRLYVQQVEWRQPVAITPEGQGYARMPHWSPDGQLLLSAPTWPRADPCPRRLSRVLVPRPPAVMARCGLVAGRKIDRLRSRATRCWCERMDGAEVRGLARLERSALLQLVARWTLGSVRLGQSPVRPKRGLRQHRHQQHLGNSVHGRSASQGDRR